MHNQGAAFQRIALLQFVIQYIIRMMRSVKLFFTLAPILIESIVPCYKKAALFERLGFPRRQNIDYNGVTIPARRGNHVIFNHADVVRDHQRRNSSSTISSIYSSAALIAGTTVGGGFLALPTVTSPVGALPACLCLVLCWTYLTGCALSLSKAIFLLSAQDGFQHIEKLSIFGVAKISFGDRAGFLAAALYLILMLATLVAQLSKIGIIFSFNQAVTSIAIKPIAITIFSILMYAVAFAKDRTVNEKINNILTTVMVGSFFSLMAMTPLCGLDLSRWHRSDFSPLLLSAAATAAGQPWAVPVFLQLLVYTEVVPVVCSRLRDERKVRQAILIGSIIPLIMCIIWTLLAIGLVPYSPSNAGLIVDPVDSLMRGVQTFAGADKAWSFIPPWLLKQSLSALALSAISTTVIGSLITISQFLEDLLASSSLSIPSTSFSPSIKDEKISERRRTLLRVLSIALPAAVVMAGSKTLYYAATEFAGAFPVTLLWGLLPKAASLKLASSRTHNGKASTLLSKLGYAGEISLFLVSIILIVVNTYLAIFK